MRMPLRPYLSLLIIVPDNGLYDSKELAKMVNEVNSKEVPTRDQLSGNVYHYDAKKHNSSVSQIVPPHPRNLFQYYN